MVFKEVKVSTIKYSHLNESKIMMSNLFNFIETHFKEALIVYHLVRIKWEPSEYFLISLVESVGVRQPDFN